MVEDDADRARLGVDQEAAAVLLEVMRSQLETLSPEEFREGWGIA